MGPCICGWRNQASVGNGYNTLASQLANFSYLSHVDNKQLDDGDKIKTTFMRLMQRKSQGPGQCGSFGTCLDCVWLKIKSQTGSGIFSSFKRLDTCFWLPLCTGLIFSQVPSGIPINRWDTVNFRLPANAIEQFKHVIALTTLNTRGIYLKCLKVLS